MTVSGLCESVFPNLFLSSRVHKRFPQVIVGKPEDEMYDAIIRPCVLALTYISRGGGLETKEKFILGKASKKPQRKGKSDNHSQRSSL